MPRPTPLRPRHGKILRVLVVARISGCQNQKELSLGDQADHAKLEIGELYEGDCIYHIIATTGKGERLDRPELAEVESRIKAGLDDVVFMEDVGRMVRGTAAVELWGMAVDRGIRCIAPNDGCDTADDSWEEELISACKDHVSHCAHTSRRIKKKQMNRFVRYGGALPQPVAGYIKPEGAKHYSDLRKDESAIPIIREGLEVLKRTENWSATADFFNQQGFATGPLCRNDQWSGVMVRRLYHNPILKGTPQRGAMRSVKHNETGRRLSKPNPDGPTYREEPHLAFFTAEELDPVLRMIDGKNKRGRKPDVEGKTPSGTRKRTRFPGQCAICWYCGSDMVWGGNGVTHNLMCNGSRHYTCWNSFGFDGPLAAKLVMDSISKELVELQGFDDQFRDLVQATINQSNSVRSEQIEIDQARRRFQLDKQNLLSALRRFGDRSLIGDELDRVEQEEYALSERQYQLELRATSPGIEHAVENAISGGCRRPCD